MYDTFATDRLIDLWLTEDIGAFDLTAQTMIEASEEASFHMNAREPMTVSGIAVAARVFQRYDPTLRVKVLVADGQRVEKGAILLEVSGSARSMLTAERTALNIVQRLSGIATETARYVDAIAGTKARLLDTRKTTPGLRALEKHAAACGGALNHRLGLDSGKLTLNVEFEYLKERYNANDYDWIYSDFAGWKAASTSGAYGSSTATLSSVIAANANNAPTLGQAAMSKRLKQCRQQFAPCQITGTAKNNQIKTHAEP